MAKQIQFDADSVILEIDLGVAGIGNESPPALVISTKCDVEATATVYEDSAGEIETIATLGTYVAPTSGKCRFKETDIPGIYQLQLADARFSITNAKTLLVNISGVAGLPATGLTYEIEFFRDPTIEEIAAEVIEQLGDSYQAKVWMQDDNGGTADRYVVAWYKNSQPT